MLSLQSRHQIKSVFSVAMALSLLTACPPQPTANAPTDPQASASTGSPAQPGASATPVPQAGESTPPVPGTSPSPGANPIPEASPTPATDNGSATVTLPDNLSSIRFATVNRFLNQKGESSRIQVELLDHLGNLIPLTVPLEWTSSRPQEISVDAEGNISALVDFGFSTIAVRIPGTKFEARTVVNVNSVSFSGGSGGGGGGASPVVVNTAPVIQSLQASRTSVVGAGVLVKLTASATDADSTLTSASYSWSCASNCENQLTSTQGESVYWRSPATAGSFSLKLSVSDGKSTSSQSIKITVQNGQGQLQINPAPIT